MTAPSMDTCETCDPSDLTSLPTDTVETVVTNIAPEDVMDSKTFVPPLLTTGIAPSVVIEYCDRVSLWTRSRTPSYKSKWTTILISVDGALALASFRAGRRVIVTPFCLKGYIAQHGHRRNYF